MMALPRGMRDRRLREKERCIDVCAEGLVPLFGIDIGNVGISALKGSIVDQNVDTAQLIDGPLHEHLAVILRLDVAGDDDGFAPCFPDPFCGVVGVVVLAQIRDRNIGALSSKGDRHSFADPRIRACYKGSFAFKISIPPIGFSPWSGTGRMAVTRRLLLLCRIGRRVSSVIIISMLVAKGKHPEAATVPGGSFLSPAVEQYRPKEWWLFPRNRMEQKPMS